MPRAYLMPERSGVAEYGRFNNPGAFNPRDDDYLVFPNADWSRSSVGDALENVADQARLLTLPGYVLDNIVSLEDYEEDYDYNPFTDPMLTFDDLRVRDIMKARSAREAQQTKQRYERSIFLRQQMEAQGGIGSEFMSALIDPASYVPLPIVKGMSFLRQATRSAAIAGGSTAPMEVLRARADPASTRSDAALVLGTTALFGAALTSTFHVIARRRELSDKFSDVIGRAGRVYDAHQGNARGMPETAAQAQQAASRSGLESLAEAGRQARTHVSNVMGKGADDVLETIGTMKRDAGEAIERVFNTNLVSTENLRKIAKAIADELPSSDPIRAKLGQILDAADGTSLRVAWREGVLGPNGSIHSLIDQLAPEQRTKALRAINKIRDEVPEIFTQEGQSSLGVTPRAKGDAKARGVGEEELEEFATVDDQVDLVREAREIHQQAKARAEQTRRGLDAQLEQARAVVERARRNVDSPEADAILVSARERLLQLEHASRFIDEQLESITEQIRGHDQVLADADTARHIDAPRFEPGLGTSIRMSQWPFMRLVNNAFRGAADSPIARLGAKIARDVHRVAGSPGLRTVGMKSGIAPRPSVEMKALQLRARFESARNEGSQAYLEYLGIASARPSARILAVRAQQAASQVTERLRGQAGELEPDAKMSHADFSTLVARTIINGGRIPDAFQGDANVVRFAEQAARAHRELYESVEVEAKVLNMFRSQRTLNHNIERTTARIGRMSGRLESLKVANDAEPSARKAQRIQEMEDELTLKEMELEQHQAALEEFIANPRELTEGAYFPIVYDRPKVQADHDEIVQVLIEEFQANPYRIVNGKTVELAGDIDSVRARAEDAYQHILNRAESLDHEGMNANNAILRDLEAKMSELMVKRGRFDNDVFPQPPIAKVVGPRTDGKLASIRYLGDGSFIVHIDEAAIRGGYARGDLPRRVMDQASTADDAVKFFEEHEFAHARLRRRSTEDVSTYEARINDEAENVLKTGTRRDERLVGIDDEIAKLKRLIERTRRDDGGGPGTMISRNLDIPRERLEKWIVLDPERVGEMYVHRMGPMMEMAREFGDYRMSNYLSDLAEEIDEVIAAAPDADVEHLMQEREAVFDSFQVIRDKVLGTYGRLVEPDALGPRAIYFLKNWATLAYMGKGWMMSTVDAGKTIMHVGLGPFINHGKAFIKNADVRNITGGEIKAAGLMSQLASSARMRSLLDLDGDFRGQTGVERITKKATDHMFLLNGMSFLTDFMQHFSGGIVQHQMIERAVKIVDGTASADEIARAAEAGMDRFMAGRIAEQWRINARGATEEGVFLANTNMWDDKNLVRDFRAMMAGEIHKTVMQPGAADKPNFVSTPMGGAIGHLRGFIFASHWRVFNAAYQQFGERPAQIMGGLAAMVAMAYGVGELKAAMGGYHNSGSFDEKLYDAIESSGVTGLLGDLNSILETTTGNTLGLRPSLGMNPKFNDPHIGHKMGAALGPVAGQWSTLIWAMTSPEADDSDEAKALRYMMPLNNLWFWSRMFDGIEQGMAGAE